MGAGIQKRQSDKAAVTYPRLAAMGYTAFDQHDNKRRQSTKNHPSDRKEIYDAVPIVVHPYNRVLREPEYELMQVIGQHQQEKGSSGYVKEIRPFRRRKFSGSPSANATNNASGG